MQAKKNQHIEEHIKSLIAVNGPLPIDEFMAIVIPHYYANNEPFGSKGDFITAPEISQMFGEIIGIWCANHWLNSSQPKFSLVEIGGGKGTLMSDLLRGTKHIEGFHNALDTIHMVETSPALQARQQKALEGYNVGWHQDLSTVKGKHLIFICNELFDALPIKQFIKTKEGFKEILVTLENNKLTYAHSSYTVPLDVKCEEGAIIEKSKASIAIANQISDKISDGKGAALIIDYGYTEPTFKSTLQAVKNHKYHSVLEDIGKADLTAHVDFKALAETFSNSRIATQGEFLLSYGIQARAEQLARNGANPKDIESQLNRLVSNDQMGELFKVLEVS